MSDYSYGLCVLSEYASSMESYCENNNIDFMYWAGISEPSVSGKVEYLFKTEADRKKAREWVQRLEKLDGR